MVSNLHDPNNNISSTVGGFDKIEATDQNVIGSILKVSIVLLIIILTFNDAMKRKKKNHKNDKQCLSGPRPFPILGSIHYLGLHDIPFEGFTYLSKFYGDMFRIRLGLSDCIVLNTSSLATQMLTCNKFNARPHFERFRILFGGDTKNALAFSEYNRLHRFRRSLMRYHLYPSSNSDQWWKLNQTCDDEWNKVMEFIIKKKKEVTANKNNDKIITVDIKELISKAVANIFNVYVCNADPCEYDDTQFCEYVDAFDKIFWEVNNGRLCDFIPQITWPSAFLAIIETCKNARTVRSFVKHRLLKINHDGVAMQKGRAEDFLSELKPFVEGDRDEYMTSEQSLYALEDVLGGHSAVGSIIVRCIWDVASNQNCQKIIRSNLTSPNCWSLKASLNETLRLTCSPIVPHKAVEDAYLNDVFIEKDTTIFINNHMLNMSEELWGPNFNKYDPIEHFTKVKAGEGGIHASSCKGSRVFHKPSHFIPFSVGKRACIGYRMVEIVSQRLLHHLLNTFEVRCNSQMKDFSIPKGFLATQVKTKILVDLKFSNL